jgi:tagatose-1,6-bisphosphate aldolase non-catalytic subunit AgaZ/GatZ
MNLADLIARNRAGQAVGLPSWCTAHPETLAAILHRYRDDAAPILIEASRWIFANPAAT